MTTNDSPSNSLPTGTQAHKKQLYKIALIGGDGIGPEVINAGASVLRALASTSKSKLAFEFVSFDWSSERYLSQGSYMPKDALTTLRSFDAI